MLRLLLARARAAAAPLAAAAALLLLAAGASTVALTDPVERLDAEVRRAVAGLPPDRGVTTVRAEVADDPVAQHDAVLEDVRRVGAGGFAVSRSVRGALTGVLEPDGAAGRRVVPVAYDEPAALADLTAGQWPAADGQGALHAAAAEALGVGVGDVLVLDGPDGRVRIEVTGTWRPHEPGDPRFGGDPLEVTGARDARTLGPLVVPDVAAAGLDPTPTVRWRIAVDPAAVRADRLTVLADGVDRLRDVVTGDPRTGRQVQVGGPGGAPLRDLAARAAAARAAALVPAVLLVVLASVTLLAVGVRLAAWRAAQTRLLAARGASAGTLGGLALLEVVALAVPVSAVVTVAGAGLAAGTPDRFPAGTGTALTAGGAALLAGPALVAAWTAGRPAGRRAGDPAGPPQPGGRRTAVLRAGTDVVLVSLSLLATWRLRRDGPLAAGGAVDAVAVAAPVLCLLAGAVLAVRVLPPVAAAALAPLARGSGLVGPLAAWDLIRRPSRYGLPVLLVALAAGAATLVLATSRAVTGDALVAAVAGPVAVLALTAGGLLAVGGSAVVALADARRQRRERAVLAALGTTGGQLRAVAAGRTVAVLLTGLLAGWVTGTVVAHLTVPPLQALVAGAGVLG
ncbi:hypothetical protein ACFP6A_08100 [Quadrisphaera sp. GCM10027208]|uniref:hypothetical protein n=1 Tax=Quadrisphaera sp. GCM10027208 TaxID=3273423 RepID=UPI003612D009